MGVSPEGSFRLAGSFNTYAYLFHVAGMPFRDVAAGSGVRNLPNVEA
jgi:hypothetical protein